jgi:hypothetical protein
MKTQQKWVLTFVLAMSAATVAGGAQAASNSDLANRYGEAVPDIGAVRHIALTPDSKSINVNNGDTVKFTENGQSFEWHFDTLKDRDNFDIAAIAPKDMHLEGVRVYVEANPLYRN